MQPKSSLVQGFVFKMNFFHDSFHSHELCDNQSNIKLALGANKYFVLYKVISFFSMYSAFDHIYIACNVLCFIVSNL
jgi:hypothetical protein